VQGPIVQVRICYRFSRSRGKASLRMETSPTRDGGIKKVEGAKKLRGRLYD